MLAGINTDKLFARAPIDDVMLKEKLNGWGRTLRGLERLGAKLKKNPTTAHQGAQVLEYTANAWLSRKLQSGNLELQSGSAVFTASLRAEYGAPRCRD